MFNADFLSKEKGEIVLVANHYLFSIEAVDLSIKYNLARVKYGKVHAPPYIKTFRIIYDIRGQEILVDALEKMETELSEVAIVEFKRD